MKPVSFFASINKGDNLLKCQARDSYVTVNDDFTVKIRESSYKIKEISNSEKWLEFQIAKRHDGSQYLEIKDSKEKIFFSKDNIKIVLKQYESENNPSISESGQNYKVGDELSVEGYGGEAVAVVRQTDEQGGVVSVDLENIRPFYVDYYRELKTEGGSGEGCVLNALLSENNQKTTIEKTVVNSYYSNSRNYINFEYEIPEYVTEGEINFKRSVIILEEPSKEDVPFGALCIAQKIDFSEKLNIPFVEKGTINAYNLYNRGAQIIEDKIFELEKRIDELESRL